MWKPMRSQLRMPWRTTSTQGRMRMMSHGGKGMWRKKPILHGRPSEGDAAAVERYLRQRRATGSGTFPEISSATLVARFEADPAHLALDLGELDADLERAGRHEKAATTGAKRSMASTVATGGSATMASCTPAAPREWPESDLVEPTTGIVRSAKASLTALSSWISPAGVLVPWALM